MAKFHVAVREIYIKMVEIDAQDEEHAKIRVNAGMGKIVDEPRFLVQLNPDHWNAYPATEGDSAEAMEESGDT